MASLTIEVVPLSKGHRWRWSCECGQSDLLRVVVERAG